MPTKMYRVKLLANNPGKSKELSLTLATQYGILSWYTDVILSSLRDNNCYQHMKAHNTTCVTV